MLSLFFTIAPYRMIRVSGEMAVRKKDSTNVDNDINVDNDAF